MLTVIIDPPATATVPLYLGVLSVVEHWRRGPVLYLTVRCDRCRRDHVHGWGLDADGPRHRTGHCGNRPTRDLLAGYWIFPEPSDANRRVLEQYRVALDAHQREEAARG